MKIALHLAPLANLAWQASVTAALLLLSLPASAQDFAGHLAAGEFGPAAKLAADAPGLERDRMLAEIAKAQAALGASRASWSTAGSIADDGARKGMMNFLGGAPIDAPSGGRGGAALADFDSLIDLMTSTIAPDSWDEVGGPGAVEPFPGGVLVDASGLLKKLDTADADRSLAHSREFARTAHGNGDVRSTSKLRKVSLTKLERQLQQLAARGGEPDDTMRNLAGLQKVEYVFVYPEQGDIVIAGPASDWAPDGEGRNVSVDTGLPTLQLDDLIVMLRVARQRDPVFGCSITPVRDRLARIQAFLAESAKTPLKSGDEHRDRWIQQLRDTLGKQTIEINNIDPTTRAARVLIEADYRMKLVGMGLEEGVPGVDSYLDMVPVGPNGETPPMPLLRWWFTINYDALQATPDHSAFALKGQGVKVLSENERLSKAGERIHTGTSDAPTSMFASNFTKHFPQLARKYPVYAELRNIFDLALVAQLIRHEDLTTKLDWQMLHFLDDSACSVERGSAPTEVESVVNYRLVRQRHVIAGISGGVRADLRQVVSRPADTSDFGYLKSQHGGATQPPQLAKQAWWWD